MSTIRVRKCKNNDSFRFRFRRKGESKDMTQVEISRFKKLNFLVSTSINIIDKSLLINEFPNKQVVFLN